MYELGPGVSSATDFLIFWEILPSTLFKDEGASYLPTNPGLRVLMLSERLLWANLIPFEDLSEISSLLIF